MNRFVCVVGVVLVGASAAGCASAPTASAASAASEDAGTTEWLQTSGGRLKARTFAHRAGSDHPVLVVVLHGDAPFNKPQYQYRFAERAAAIPNVIATAILRPGYTDPSGDRSAGVRGMTTGDNYTRDRIDAIAGAIEELKRRHRASEVVLVGHSGGAALSADILALHPEVARRAVLVSCPCDVPTWRAHMKQLQHAPVWDAPVESVSPLEVAERVPANDQVLLITGTADEVAPPALTAAYAKALSAHGVHADVVQLPGKDHEILLDPAVEQQLRTFIGSVEQKPTP